jgi:L-threonylcarbamoyladenylate synthase
MIEQNSEIDQADLHQADLQKADLKQADLQQAVAVIQEGGVLIYPTETVYGIGGDANQEALIRRVQRIKGRDGDKPMLVLTDEWERAHEWIANCTPLHQALMKSGLPITILFEPTNAVPTALRGTSPLVGIRKSSHPLCQSLIQQSNCLLLSTSANLSGKMPVSDVQFLDADLVHQADFVLDGGALTPSLPSTVVAVLGGKLKILREGNISEKQIQYVI